LEGIEAIDRLLLLEEEGALQILGEKFDICINFDNDPLACSLASHKRAPHHLGFILDDSGRVVAANPEAAQWLEMASFDRIKKENTQTYQRHMRRIAGLDPDTADPIQVRLTAKEKEGAIERLSHLGFSGCRPFAFNTGSGERWKTKRWPMEHFLQLGFLLTSAAPGRILLLGGPHEKEANDMLAMERPDLFISAGAMPLREFMAVVAECGLLVTSDTLALHIGLGAGVPTVALFGPTSAEEIEGVTKLLKIVSPRECAQYYRKECGERPCCMEEITPSLVYESLKGAGWLEKEHPPCAAGAGA
jgi:ADP-heptose:LPS heptosyltransferase